MYKQKEHSPLPNAISVILALLLSCRLNYCDLASLFLNKVLYYSLFKGHFYDTSQHPSYITNTTE